MVSSHCLGGKTQLLRDRLVIGVVGEESGFQLGSLKWFGGREETMGLGDGRIEIGQELTGLVVLAIAQGMKELPGIPGERIVIQEEVGLRVEIRCSQRSLLRSGELNGSSAR